MIVALDFDGVIFDGTNECLLIAWNVFKKNRVKDFNIEVFDKIPTKFNILFKKLRNFVRHDGHFLVPFYIKEKMEINSDCFYRVYESIPQQVRLEFRENFNKYRSRVRKVYSTYWLGLHKKLINLEDIINLNIDVRIISGKDTDSIFFILQSNNINLSKEKIQGGMSSKVLSLEAMKSEAISRGQKILFIDDNIDNVIESINIGVDSFWATWGYHTAEHINKAKQFLIKEVEKENILSTIIDYKKEIKK